MNQKSFTAFGITFGIKVHDEALWARIEEHLPPGTQSATASPTREYVFTFTTGQHYLLVNGQPLCHNFQLAPALEVFENDLQIYVAEFAAAHIFVHAGVVSWQGEALLFPGRSFSGKSTLITALLRAGAHYLSDEYAAFDLDGHVHPYPRRISLRREHGGSQRIDAREIGIVATHQPLQVTTIFLCHFEPSASWQPQLISPGRALLALLDNTVAARSQTATALEVLGKVVENATSWQGVRGEANTCLDKILG